MPDNIPFNSQEPLTDLSTYTSIGEKQWTCITHLEEQYKNKSINRISNNVFTSERWNCHGSNRYDFKWNEWLPEPEHKPLLLLCKIATFILVQIRGLKVSTIQPRVIGFINTFKEMLACKRILIANEGEQFKGLGELLKEDISLAANKNLQLKGKLGQAPFQFIEDLTTIEAPALFRAYFMVSDITTPWSLVDLDVRKWVPSLKKALGLSYKQSHYMPLTIECSSSIVSTSLMIINEYGDIITDLFNQVEVNIKKLPENRSRKFPKSLNTIIKNKFQAKLDKILPMTLTSKGQLHQSYYSNLQKLTQSACAWIILLTTGLRNIDLRKLSTKACIASKRSDNIFYLVSDIQKTDLVNYVLPIPPQTAKAFELATKAKLNRGGKVVFHKITPKISDSSINDEFYMGEESAFNNLLRFLPNHFDIKLETIDPSVDVTAHCGRSTLAGFIGANSTAAILILKKLFGHSNDLMPDAYINYNPLVIAERNRNILSAQQSLAEDIALAISSDNVAGIKGEQLKNGAETIKAQIAEKYKNESLTEMDLQVKLFERLKEMLLQRMTDNHIFALLTPMSVVCLRTTNDTTDSPCSAQENQATRKRNGISKAVTDVMATLPTPSRCVGIKCSDALIGKPWSDGLLDTLKFYINYLNSVDQVYDLKQEAKRFVTNYSNVLEELYKNEFTND